jgi:hypothetical protein
MFNALLVWVFFSKGQGVLCIPEKLLLSASHGPANFASYSKIGAAPWLSPLLPPIPEAWARQ